LNCTVPSAPGGLLTVAVRVCGVFSTDGEPGVTSSLVRVALFVAGSVVW
jgi:hypothetical protein